MLRDFLGKKVKYDIDNASGVNLIPAGTVIHHYHITLLKRHSVDPNAIKVMRETETQLNHIVKNAVDISKKLFDTMGHTRKIPVMDIRNEILPVIHQVSDNSNIFQLFQAVRATDEYTYQHNIGVGILATLIGKWLNLSESDLSTLSLAATLHDVGKVKVPPEILNKPGKLTVDEYEIVKKHTIFGYELLKDTIGLNRRIPLVALQHHERNDGKGYPFGLKDDKIDYFSKIVAVADIFHAMSSKRPYHEPIPFHKIVSQMSKGKFGELEPKIVSVFLENIVKKLIGVSVVLTDGSVGEVVYLNPHNIESPLIKVKNEFVDLSKNKNLRIKEVSI